MKSALKAFCICTLMILVNTTEINAQQNGLTRTRIDSETIDLNRIFGHCGCKNCGGISEHNNPTEGDETNQFQLVNRWSNTVMSGGGLGQGDPTILTWSIVPDGTDANGGGGFVPSNLIAVFDNLFNEPNAGSSDLTNRTWHGLIEQALNRWGEVSGIEYVYEPNDDGLSTFGAGGSLGVRGDVRIGGFNIDGPGSVLAFNDFPNDGDMAIDTSDTGLFGNPGINFRLFRNVFAHEQGHGLGFAHVVSNNAAFLMEPSISGSFDGPQMDEIRAIHRNYGDVFEKSNDFEGNDNINDATDLGLIVDGGSITIGTDSTTGTLVSLFDDDFVSIDDNNDTDFYKFTVNEIVFVDITLTPVGPTYNQSPQGGNGGTPINTSESSNLTLGLFDSNGSPEAVVNTGGAGDAETITDQLLVPGDYFVRATGAANTIQLYTLAVSVEGLQLPTATAPSVANVNPGVIVGGSVGDLLNADNSTMDLQPTIPDAKGDEPIVALFTIFSPDPLVSSISFSYEGSGTTPNLDQTFSVLNSDTGSFEQLDSRAVTLNDTDFTLNPDGNPQRFVAFPSGLILVELRYDETGPVLMYPWTIRIDRLVASTLD